MLRREVLKNNACPDGGIDMAINVAEFWKYYLAVPYVQQIIALPAQPFGATIATGRAMGIKVLFVVTGVYAGTTYIGIDEWNLAGRYSSTNTLSGTASHRTAGRVAQSGTVGAQVDTLSFSVSGGIPRIAWTPMVPDLDWTVRGHLWVASAA